MAHDEWLHDLQSVENKTPDDNIGRFVLSRVTPKI
jgi:hypothetical protein